MSKEEKKRRKTGMLVAFLFHATFIAILFSFTIDNKVKEKEPELILFDFSGASAKGGSSSRAAKSKSETETSSADPVKTQKSDSPVTKTKSTSKSKSKSTSKTKSVNKKATAGAGTFGNNKGSGSGTSDGDGEENGNGEGTGPGVSGKIGKLGSRKVLYRPAIKNPIKEEGTVMVEVTVLRSGKVESVRILRNHPKTTSTNPLHIAAAKKMALKYKFAPNPNAKEFETGILPPIRFILE